MIYNKAGVVNLGSSVTLKPNGEESVGIVNASGKATSASGPIDTTLNTAATITGTGKMLLQFIQLEQGKQLILEQLL